MLKGKSGVTLMEILVAVVLFSIVFIGTASAYHSAQNLFLGLRGQKDKLDAGMAMEFMARQIRQGYQATIEVGGDQLSIHWDNSGIGATNFDPLGATDSHSNPVGDTYIKFAFVGGGLHYESPAAVGYTVLGTDPEAVEGLVVVVANSSFTKVDENKVEIDMHVMVGNPPVERSFFTEVQLSDTRQIL